MLDYILQKTHLQEITARCYDNTKEFQEGQRIIQKLKRSKYFCKGEGIQSVIIKAFGFEQQSKVKEKKILKQLYNLLSQTVTMWLVMMPENSKDEKDDKSLPEYNYDCKSQYSHLQIIFSPLTQPLPPRGNFPFDCSVLIQNNKLTLQSIFKLRKKVMYFYPANMYSPQSIYYFYLPITPPNLDHQYPSAPEPQSTIQEKQMNFLEDGEEKIILTQSDLQKEGYEQNKRPWSAEQDRLLLRLCKDQNARFQQIASKIQGRNAKMCYSRYRRLAHQNKSGWTKAQNEKLISLINDLGQTDWKILASHFKEKNHKQLKQHYNNYLKPEIIKSQWTMDEDLELIRLFNKYGKDWKSIQDNFLGRSRSQIKNRFFGKITRLNRKKIEAINLKRKQ